MKKILNMILRPIKIYIFLIKPRYYGRIEYLLFNLIKFKMPYNNFKIENNAIIFTKIPPKDIRVNCTYECEELSEV